MRENERSGDTRARVQLESPEGSCTSLCRYRLSLPNRPSPLAAAAPTRLRRFVNFQGERLLGAALARERGTRALRIFQSRSVLTGLIKRPDATRRVSRLISCRIELDFQVGDGGVYLWHGVCAREREKRDPAAAPRARPFDVPRSNTRRAFLSVIPVPRTLLHRH